MWITDAEVGYKADDSKRGLLSTNRIRELVKQHLGLDWDTLTNEQEDRDHGQVPPAACRAGAGEVGGAQQQPKVGAE